MSNSHSQPETKPQRIGIVGAGLVGCLAALAFQRRGYAVSLFDFRPDPKLVDGKSTNLRSINLAVSSRGIRALEQVDPSLTRKIISHVTPMTGRMIHDVSGTKQELQQYGLYGESINSIDRSFLNECLLDEIRESGVDLCFNHKLVKVEKLDSAEPTLTFDIASQGREEARSFDYVIGADGAHSSFRYQMQRSMRMDYSQKYVDMQYLELYIPPNKDKSADSPFHFDPNHLHIWPRHNYMLIALANMDGSFTVTFFSPWLVIESIESGDAFVTFFKDNFPDAVPLLGEEHLRDVYANHPRGSLMQVSLYPYHHPNKRALLIGDAAHSMVPFYGQGMNCGFEDVRVLLDLISQNNGDICTAFAEYSATRKPDLDAICKLALDNYNEMSSKVTSVWYLARKKLDGLLSRHFNGRFMTWLPLYTMISFRSDISYAKAIEIEKRQARILTQIQYGVIGAIAITAAAKASAIWGRR